MFQQWEVSMKFNCAEDDQIVHHGHAGHSGPDGHGDHVGHGHEHDDNNGDEIWNEKCQWSSSRTSIQLPTPLPTQMPQAHIADDDDADDSYENHDRVCCCCIKYKCKCTKIREYCWYLYYESDWKRWWT